MQSFVSGERCLLKACRSHAGVALHLSHGRNSSCMQPSSPVVETLSNSYIFPLKGVLTLNWLSLLGRSSCRGCFHHLSSTGKCPVRFGLGQIPRISLLMGTPKPTVGSFWNQMEEPKSRVKEVLGREPEWL